MAYGGGWSYAPPAGGLVNTSGVTIKAAAGANRINYVTSLGISNSHATIGTEVVIRDGANGPVLWRIWISAQHEITRNFVPPLAGSANTLLEIAEITQTATTGVLVNVSGISGN